MIIRKLGYSVLRTAWKLSHPLTVGVRALLVSEGNVLLVRHTYQDHWYLPGGRVEKRETLEEAIRRELDEEIAATLENIELFGVYTSFYESKSDHVVVFETSEFSVGVCKSNEIESVEQFPFDDLPAAVSPGSRRRIEEYLQDERPRFGLW